VRHGWSKLMLAASVVLVTGGCSAVVPQAGSDVSTLGARASVDDRLVAAAQPLLPGYTYGGITDTAEAVCDAFQSGASWKQERQVLVGPEVTPAAASSFMQVSIGSYCGTYWQLIPLAAS
jgi:hypothetical protein